MNQLFLLRFSVRGGAEVDWPADAREGEKARAGSERGAACVDEPADGREGDEVRLGPAPFFVSVNDLYHPATSDADLGGCGIGFGDGATELAAGTNRGGAS